MGPKPDDEGVPLTGGRRCLQFFKNYWRKLIVLTVPFALLPIFIINNTPPYRCMYVVSVMAIFWVTEALPLPITSLIPVVAFPLMDILPTDRTCQMYFKGTVMMFFGGLVLALAIEYSNLHKRIALGSIILIGCGMRRLHFGLVAVTTFVSMWISNTAATAMMLPIIQAVLEELEMQGLCKIYEEGTEPVEGDVEGLKNKRLEREEPLPTKITLCFYVGAAYASSLGGCGTLIGTGTNLTFKGIYEGRFPDSYRIDFLKFMFYAVPLMIIQSFFNWIWLQMLYMGLFRPKSNDAKKIHVGKEGEQITFNVIKSRYHELGRITAHEIGVAICFVIAVILLFTMDPGFIQGWAKIITKKTKVSDATPTIFICILFFLIPASWECTRFFTKRSDVPRQSSLALINWKYIAKKIPWGLLFLLGGGFAVAEGGKVSGMNKLIGNSLVVLSHLNSIILLLIVVIFSQVLTQFSSNVAIANIVLPVLAEMAVAIKVHPLYLLLPAALSCSMGFHLPVSTPPNALIAGFAHVRTKQMVVAGIGPTVITLITIWLWTISWGMLIYPDTATFPDWARRNETNQTIKS